MFASFRSTTQTMVLIVKHRKKLRVLPRSILTLTRTRRLKSSDPNLGRTSKKLFQRHKSGPRTTRLQRRSQTSSFPRNTTSETSMVLILPTHFEIRVPVVHATQSPSLK